MFGWLRGRRATALTEPKPSVPEGSPALSLDKVFNPGAYEVGPTYVPRKAAEDAVREALAQPNAIVLFHGPSKSGKTVLCHRLTAGLPKAHVFAFTKMTSDRFWDALRLAIEVPEVDERISRTDQFAQADRSIRSEIGGKLAGMGAEVGVSTSEGSGTVESRERRTTIASPGMMGVINHLRTNPTTIIIDDYHWMNPEIAEDIFPPLKQVLGWGSKVILISVTRSAFPRTGDFADFIGRFVDIEMKPWEPGEIREIAERGFRHLNITATEQTIVSIVGCSYLSPLIAQSLCKRLCMERGIERASAKSIHLSASRTEIGAVAALVAAPSTTPYDPIIDNDEAKVWQTKPRDNRKLSLAEVFVLGVSHKRPFEPFTLKELVKRIEDQLLQKPLPANFPALIAKKALEIQAKFGGEGRNRSPIFYDPVEKTVTIVDPYFKLWARWVRGPKLGGKLFD